MKQELQNKLYEKYPKIFAQKDLPMSQTSMCYGIECGSGWYNIIDALCENIQNYVDQNRIEQVEATQIKEKFGSSTEDLARVAQQYLLHYKFVGAVIPGFRNLHQVKVNLAAMDKPLSDDEFEFFFTSG